MENRKSKEEPSKEDKESHTPENTSMSTISICTNICTRSNNAKNAIHLNNLLLETVQTLNDMRNIISNFDIQQSMLMRQIEKHSDIPIKMENLIQKNKLIIDKFSNSKTKMNNLLFPKTESQKQIYVQEEDKDKITITNELKKLVELINIIFQKLDDPNYVCEKIDCQLLKENLINHEINNSNNVMLNESNQIVNKEYVNHQNIKDPGTSRPLIKNIKFDPNCKGKIENQQNDKKILNNNSQCTCSLVKKYNKHKNCLYINYGGRILEINCLNIS